MRIDLYQRAEPEGHLSYLAVPEGKVIPEEVINTEWADVARGMELDNQQANSTYAIEDAEQQINKKGYAITGLNKLA
ncbi:hypothetical protein IMCC9480_3255 [Oxalobacteraceae bacterium IMCC9480]|nr:hypothetical protein IMCC9480_3255 [Oxalobacteraceae bacterium IMCC9480]NDP58151.1 hypothetical protein [Oxalobacteraceae bacterium]